MKNAIIFERTGMAQDIQGGPQTITRYLQEWKRGETGALERLTAQVYRELQRLAGAVIGGYDRGHTIQPTVLVHELYFQLPGVRNIDWHSRAQFLNVAARMMRNILVDHARMRNAAKRGGGELPLLIDAPAEDPALHVDVLVVHEALQRFNTEYPRQARVVELKFFGGLTTEETARVLAEDGDDVGVRTIERDWTFARAWLQDAIGC